MSGSHCGLMLTTSIWSPPIVRPTGWIPNIAPAFCFRLLPSGSWDHILSSVNVHKGWNGVQVVSNCPKSSPNLQRRNVGKAHPGLPSQTSWVCCCFLEGGHVNGTHSGLSLSLALSSVDEGFFKILPCEWYPSILGLAGKPFPLWALEK